MRLLLVKPDRKAERRALHWREAIASPHLKVGKAEGGKEAL